LGSGSIALAAVDAEFTLRTLLKNYKILYSSKVKVCHNRWLTKEENRKQGLSYSCGETACYGYFALQGKKFAKKIVVKNFKDSYKNFKKSLELIFAFKKYGIEFFFHSLQELIFRLRGLIVALYFSKKDPL
jgi:hypothetical protein